MWRLALAELRSHARLWSGLSIVAAVAGAVLSIASALGYSALAGFRDGELSDRDFEGLIGFVATPALLTGITLVVVLSNLGRQAVDAQRRAVALWQMCGTTPRQTRWILLTQIGVAAAICGTLGALVALPCVHSIFQIIATAVPAISGLQIGGSPLTVLLATALTTALSLYGGRSAARSAAAVSPVELLRAPSPDRRKRRILRWCVIGYAAAAIIALAFALHSGNLAEATNAGAMLGLHAALLSIAAGPFVIARVIRLWIRCIPGNRAPSWYLAARGCQFRISTTANVVIPLTIIMILVGSTVSFAETVHSAVDAASPPQANESTLALLACAGPLVLGLLSAMATVLMSGYARESDGALTLAAGGTPAVLHRVAALEAVIYTGTAVVLSAIATLPCTFLFFSGLSVVSADAGFAAPAALSAIAVIGLGGLGGLSLASVSPGIGARHRGIRHALSIAE